LLGVGFWPLSNEKRRYTQQKKMGSLWKWIQEDGDVHRQLLAFLFVAMLLVIFEVLFFVPRGRLPKTEVLVSVCQR
jgi:hypothetical protein